MSAESQCPMSAGRHTQSTNSARSNRDWWPNQLDLKMLHQHSAQSDPMGDNFDYAKELNHSISALLSRTFMP